MLHGFFDIGNMVPCQQVTQALRACMVDGVEIYSYRLHGKHMLKTNK